MFSLLNVVGVSRCVINFNRSVEAICTLDGIIIKALSVIVKIT